MSRRHASHRAEPPISALVVVGLIAGAVLAAWWSVARHGPAEAGGVADVTSMSDEEWTDRGWDVADDHPWEGSVVRVTTRRCNDEIRGSGVIVEGAVLTNRHVVDGAASVVITLADGSAVDAGSIVVASELDLARIDAPGLPAGLSFAPREPATDAEPGSSRLVGFPSGRDLSSRAVAVDGVRRGWGFPDPQRPFHLDAEVVPGESGSAVIDRNGRVAGLVYARATDDGGGLVIGAPELRTESTRLARRPFERC